jgi:transposase
MPLPPNTLAELQRDMARLGFVVSQIREIEEARQKRLEQQPETGPHAMIRLLARIVGVGVETADMLVHEVLSRPMRDRRAVARYAGLNLCGLRRFGNKSRKLVPLKHNRRERGPPHEHKQQRSRKLRPVPDLDQSVPHC